MKKVLRTSLLSLFALTLAPFSATATPLLWTLNGTFTDGGTASGSFTYDADTNVFSNINILASGGSSGLPASAFQYISSSGSTFLVLFDSNAPDLTGAHWLMLGFNSPLTNNGGVVDVGNGSELTCNNATCSNLTLPTRGFTASGNTVTAPTPEPTTLTLIPLGVFALLLRKRILDR